MSDTRPPADAVEATLLRLYPALRRFAAVVAPTDVEPDDVCHDAIVAALRAGRLIEVDDPRAYLRRAILNVVANRKRTLGRGRAATARHGGVADSVDVYPSDLRGLDVLDPRARAVVYLHHVEGAPFVEIADQLGITPASARQIAVRARRDLRTVLEPS